MSKIELEDTAGGYNISRINANFQAIEDEFNDKVLYRDNPEGEANEMLSDLDMNGQRIYNLPTPALASEAARLQDVINAISGANQANLITFSPAGDIVATTVQGAIEEVDAELHAHIVDTTAAHVASAIGETSSHASAVATTQHQINEEEVSVFRFMTSAQIADVIAKTAETNLASALDVTAAMQAAHNTGRLVKYPAGAYKYSRLTTGITSGGIVGEGQDQTRLYTTDTSSNDLMTFVGGSPGGPNNALIFRDFAIRGPFTSSPDKVGGAAIRVLPVGSENTYSTYSNVTIEYLPIGLHPSGASSYFVQGCFFLGFTIAGIICENTYATDAGDDSVIGCTFSTTYHAGNNSGILHKSSGGLKIIGNKFLGGVYPYLMQYSVDTTATSPGGNPTSILLIVGNSFERYYNAGIGFTQAVVGAGATVFRNIAIVGNQFGVMAGTNAVGISSDTPAVAWLSNITIDANVFDMTAPAGYIAAIQLAKVSDVNIGNNTFRFNGSGTAQRAVLLDTCTNVSIGKGIYYGLINSPFTITGSTKVVIHKDEIVNVSETASSPASAGWAAYGTALFLSPASGTVLFEDENGNNLVFLGSLSLNDITLSVSNSSIGGEIAAVVSSLVTSGQTTTGFTFRMIGANNNQANTRVVYRALGVI